MLNVQSKYRGGAEPEDSLLLDYSTRQRSRFLATSRSGRAVSVVLPRGTKLTHCDCLIADSGLVLTVEAMPEDLSRVPCASWTAAARACYHLGNRHTPVQIGDGCVLYQCDHVLDRMLRALGMCVEHTTMPFEPEPGAYAHHDWESPVVLTNVHVRSVRHG